MHYTTAIDWPFAKKALASVPQSVKQRIHSLRTKGELAAFAQKAASMRFADLHSGLHTSCTHVVATTLTQTVGLSAALSVIS